MSLTESARDFVERGGYDPLPLLLECIKDGTLDGLRGTQIIFEDMYGGITFNFEIKAPAAYCLVRWEEAGLEALVEGAVRTPTSKNRSLAVEILSTLAAGLRLPQMATWIRNKEVSEHVLAAVRDWETVASIARRRLGAYILSFEDEDDVAAVMGHQFHMSGLTGLSINKSLFAAMATRWLSVSLPTLDEFERTIVEYPDDEPLFQAFLERHPQLIDPLALEVWPQPRIHGAREPDFIVRRTDDTYLVVEIETPGKTLITAANRLSAEATHAVAQATDYATFLSERLLTIRQRIPSFRQPSCLVVVGTEHALSEDQARALRVENESRHRLTIVGFDWLAHRARAIVQNVIGQRVAVLRDLRIT
jgi:hypothetical protein